MKLTFTFFHREPFQVEEQSYVGCRKEKIIFYFRSVLLVGQHAIAD